MQAMDVDTLADSKSDSSSSSLGSSSSSRSAMEWSPASVTMVLLGGVVVAQNSIVLSAVLRKRVMKARSFRKLLALDWFVMNITLADWAFGFFSTLGLLTSGGDTRTSTYAKYLSFVSSFCATASVLLLFGLAFTRYLLVREPSKRSLRNIEAKTPKSIAAIWIFVLIIFAVLSTGGLVFPARHGLSSNFDEYIQGSIPTVARQSFAIFAIIVPSSGILWFYAQILKAVNKDLVDLKVTRRVARMVAVLTWVYLGFLLPYGIMNVYEIISGRSASLETERATYMLAFGNFLSNPFIYFVFQPRYRAAILDLPGFRHLASKFNLRPKSSSAAAAELSDTRSPHAAVTLDSHSSNAQIQELEMEWNESPHMSEERTLSPNGMPPPSTPSSQLHDVADALECVASADNGASQV